MEWRFFRTADWRARVTQATTAGRQNGAQNAGAFIYRLLSAPGGNRSREPECPGAPQWPNSHHGPNVKENSFEFFARLDHRLFGRGSWALTGSIGPAIAVSAGCTAGGDFAGDAAGYGNASCTNDFADKGKVRPGIAARLTNEFRGARGAFAIAVELSGGTVAAGNGVTAAVLVGFRAPLR